MRDTGATGANELVSLMELVIHGENMLDIEDIRPKQANCYST